MKSNELASYELVVSGAQESSEFKIAANGKAFKILIDGIYSNKIQAIVRELSSNAFDSHRMADKDGVPFDLYLPNLLDPTFTVRDYGTSLSHADIMGLYTTLFQSTKEDTNNAIGKFGLGSKTPFAYTDSFTVTAFLRGTKRVYGAYIAPNGMPSISLMASEDTSEPDGLMVSFPVDAKDCESFRYETERVLTGFDVTPNVKGAQVSKTIYTTIYEGSNFKILKEKTRAMARQGCVIYPIDISALGYLTVEHRNILDSNILIDFPIGQVDITASREALSYDETTIANILAMAEKVNNEIQLKLDEEVKKANTYHKAQILKYKFSNLGIKSASAYCLGMSYNGKLVNLDYTLDRKVAKDKYGVRIDRFKKSYYSERKTMRFDYNSYSKSWSVTANTVYIYEPIGAKKASSRIRNFVDTDPNVDNVVWLKQIDHKIPFDKRAFYKLIGYAPIIEVEQLPLPVKVATVRAAPIKKEQIRIQQFTHSTANQKAEFVIDMVGKEIPYVYLSNGYFYTESNENLAYSYLKDFTDFLGLDLKDVVVIASKHTAKVKKYSNWTNVLSNENIEKLKVAAPFKEYFTNKMYKGLDDHWTCESSSKRLWDYSYDKPTSWKKLLDISNKLAYRRQDIPNENLIFLYKELAGWSKYAEIESDFNKNIVKIKTAKEIYTDEVLGEYPFLQYFSKPWALTPDHAKAIQDYIKLVDESREL